MYQVIDWKRKGNVVRFYFGKKTKEYGWYNPLTITKEMSNGMVLKYPISKNVRYHGDDWDDRPYEHNATDVYEEFVYGYLDVAIPFDYIIEEPCNGFRNSPYSKNDLRRLKIPIICIYETNEWGTRDKLIDSIYFEDNIEDISKRYLVLKEKCLTN